MARLAPARKAALSLVGRARRRGGRVRDIARDDDALSALGAADRALAFRLALGVTSYQQVLDSLIDEWANRPSTIEPRVRDALRLSCYEVCYLDTPTAVAASQGVELVRSVAPRAAGMANAVLRKLASQTRPRIDAARERVVSGGSAEADLVLVSGLPTWFVSRLLHERGDAFARSLCLAQIDPAPVYVAANGLHHDAANLVAVLQEAAMSPAPVSGLAGSFRLQDSASLATSGLVDDVSLVVADVAAQIVCRLAAPKTPCRLLEVGQGRGTKSVLLAAALDVTHPTHVAGVDSVGSKVRLSQRRMERAGLSDVVSCHELDACLLASKELPEALSGDFGVVLVDAPCSGSGTTRRHPEIAATLEPDDVSTLAELQLRMLRAASSRVVDGGVLVYATCSVLREEDEAVVEAFLASPEGAAFSIEPVCEAPSCRTNEALCQLVKAAQTPEGYLLTMPTTGGGDGHFCARLIRTGSED